MDELTLFDGWAPELVTHPALWPPMGVDVVESDDTAAALVWSGAQWGSEEGTHDGALEAWQ